MGSKKGISSANFKMIYRRQQEEDWGNTYVPSILATPQEAPSISRASILKSALLQREVHTLSLPERYAALLILHHPQCVGLQEQKAMFPLLRAHPLFGLPEMTSVDLPSFKGVIDVAERLGYLSHLPRMRIEDPDAPTGIRRPVYPYISDFLVRLRDADSGQTYCINWSIKDSYVSFKRPSLKLKQSKAVRGTESPEGILARHQIEETYYADAGIRTYRIAGDQIDPHVVANLETAFGYDHATPTVPASLEKDIQEKFAIALSLGLPAREVILAVCSRTSATEHDCRAIFYQAIWRRQLRVDLFSPVLLNRPLLPEKRDVFTVYGEWFKG